MLLPTVQSSGLVLKIQSYLMMQESPAWRARLPLSTFRKSWISSGWAKLPAIASNILTMVII